MEPKTLSKRNRILAGIATGLIAVSALGAATMGVASAKENPNKAKDAITAKDAKDTNETKDANESKEAKDEKDEKETPITGVELQKATDAAIAKVGEGKVTGSEVDNEHGTLEYEIELALSDGSTAEVKLDKDFNVTKVEKETADKKDVANSTTPAPDAGVTPNG